MHDVRNDYGSVVASFATQSEADAFRAILAEYCEECGQPNHKHSEWCRNNASHLAPELKAFAEAYGFDRMFNRELNEDVLARRVPGFTECEYQFAIDYWESLREASRK